MRIYTNFDLWNVLKFYRGLMSVRYQEVVYDLDTEDELRNLLMKLDEDQVLKIQALDQNAAINSCTDLKLSWLGELAFMNELQQVKEGKMQLGTVMLNLIEAKVLMRIPSDFH